MRDSSKLFGVLKELTLGTYSKTCIKGLKCDGKVTQEIQDRYDETSEGSQSKQVARDDLKKIFYKNETNLKEYLTHGGKWCSTL